MFITPRKGLVARDPATGEILPEAGAVIVPGPHRAYWLRRQKDKDVVIAATAPVVSGTAKAKPAPGAEEGK